MRFFFYLFFLLLSLCHFGLHAAGTGWHLLSAQAARAACAEVRSIAPNQPATKEPEGTFPSPSGKALLGSSSVATRATRTTCKTAAHPPRRSWSHSKEHPALIECPRKWAVLCLLLPGDPDKKPGPARTWCWQSDILAKPTCNKVFCMYLWVTQRQIILPSGCTLPAQSCWSACSQQGQSILPRMQWLKSPGAVCRAESPSKLVFTGGVRGMVPSHFCLMFSCLVERWNTISFQASTLGFCAFAFSFLPVPSTQGD